MLENGKEDTIERFVRALEEMIDAQDDMWEEEKNCNYRWQDKIRQERYIPARNELKALLSELIKNKVDADKAI